MECVHVACPKANCRRTFVLTGCANCGAREDCVRLTFVSGARGAGCLQCGYGQTSFRCPCGYTISGKRFQVAPPLPGAAAAAINEPEGRG